MNREIKFRAWIPALEIMLHGVTLYSSGDIGIDGGSFENALKEKNPNWSINYDGHYVDDSANEDYAVMFVMVLDEWIQIDSDSVVVMQWTGLKDEAGVDIYEGDWFEWQNTTGVIRYNGRGACFGHCYDKDSNYELIPIEQGGNLWAPLFWINPESNKGRIVGDVYRTPLPTLSKKVKEDNIFAKLFSIGDSHQVLVTLEFSESGELCVFKETSIRGNWMGSSFSGYDDRKTRAYFDDYTQESAMNSFETFNLSSQDFPDKGECKGDIFAKLFSIRDSHQVLVTIEEDEDFEATLVSKSSIGGRIVWTIEPLVTYESAKMHLGKYNQEKAEVVFNSLLPKKMQK